MHNAEVVSPYQGQFHHKKITICASAAKIAESSIFAAIVKLSRICHFSSVHPQGDTRVFLKECVSMAEHYNVDLVVTNGTGGLKKGVNVHVVEPKGSSRLRRMIFSSKAVYNKAKSLDADLYHFHDPELLPYALLLKWKGKNVVYDAHEDVPKQLMGKYWINKYLRKIVAGLFRGFENFVARRLSGVITATPYITKRFKKVNPNTITVNNFPFIDELTTVSTRVPAEKNNICYVGGITEIRGITTLVKAMENTSGVELLLAGSFSPESYAREIKKEPGWKKVHFLGPVNREQVAEIFSKSFAGIVTFQPLPNHIDAQPNKMFEYMSAGLPVIGSDFELWRSIIQGNNCGICVDPMDAKALAAAIMDLKTNAAKVKEMGQNGKNAVMEKYHWETESESLRNFYEAILNPKG